MQLPLRQHGRTILTLVCATALGAQQRGPGDGVGHQEHIAQVEPFQPLQIEGRGSAERTLAELAPQRVNFFVHAEQFLLCTERTDVVGHDILQLRDRGRAIEGRVIAAVSAGYAVCDDKLDGRPRVLRAKLRRRRVSGARRGAAPGAAAEHQCFGDGVAR